MFRTFNFSRKALFSTSQVFSKEARIFFGGFPVGSTEFAIKKAFEGCGEILSVEFFKKDSSGAGKGYGTILFSDESALDKAKSLNQTTYEGRSLTVKEWEGSYNNSRGFNPTSNNAPPNNPPSENLYVGNLRYDQDGDELLTVFSDYGNVISFRRPFDVVNNRNKGMAYIQFDSIENAQKAISGLNGFELNGRRIRVDFASGRNQSQNKNQNQIQDQN